MSTKRRQARSSCAFELCCAHFLTLHDTQKPTTHFLDVHISRKLLMSQRRPTCTRERFLELGIACINCCQRPCKKGQLCMPTLLLNVLLKISSLPDARGENKTSCHAETARHISKKLPPWTDACRSNETSAQEGQTKIELVFSQLSRGTLVKILQSSSERSKHRQMHQNCGSVKQDKTLSDSNYCHVETVRSC